MSAIDHHDDHADEPWLQHHWNNSGQQFEAGKLGMWLFLATEFLLFAGLFCATRYRSNHPELFEYGANPRLEVGRYQHPVLIASSFTMAWAVTAAQRGQVKLMNGLLFITFFGGVGFLGIKYMEYTSKFKDNIYWGTALYEEVEGVTHDLTMTNEVIADDSVMVETRFDLPAPQPENLSAVAEAPAGPGGLSASGLALLDAEQTEAHDDDHHHDHGDDHDDHEAHAHGDHGGHDDHATIQILAWIPSVRQRPPLFWHLLHHDRLARGPHHVGSRGAVFLRGMRGTSARPAPPWIWAGCTGTSST